MVMNAQHTEEKAHTVGAIGVCVCVCLLPKLNHVVTNSPSPLSQSPHLNLLVPSTQAPH